MRQVLQPVCGASARAHMSRAYQRPWAHQGGATLSRVGQRCWHLLPAWLGPRLTQGQGSLESEHAAARGATRAGAPAQLRAMCGAPQVAVGAHEGAAGVDKAAAAHAAAAAGRAARLGRAGDRRHRVQRAAVCLRGPRTAVRLFMCCQSCPARLCLQHAQCSRGAHWSCLAMFQPPAINTRVYKTTVN